MKSRWEEVREMVAALQAAVSSARREEFFDGRARHALWCRLKECVRDVHQALDRWFVLADEAGWESLVPEGEDGTRSRT